MPHINWKSVSYIINYYLTQWTDNRMPDKRGTDNRGSTVLHFFCRLKVSENDSKKNFSNTSSGFQVIAV